MELRIRVYLTTRSDPVDDLDSVQTFNELSAWKKRVKGHALKTTEHNKIGETLIKDLKGYIIQECYGLIAYPGDKMLEANQVGKELAQFLKKNYAKLTWDLEETGMSATTSGEILEEHKFLDASSLWDNFTYSLVHDKELEEDQYEIDLEFVVRPENKK